MNEPFKVIHKYKNFNRKIQYNILIFVGNILSEEINNILYKIKDKNLFNSLTELNDIEINLLINKYGDYWYKYFFINKHITYTFVNIIKANKDKSQIIIDKFSKEWYDKHINNISIHSKTLYSYQIKIKQNLINKLKLKKIKENEVNDNSYKINNEKYKLFKNNYNENKYYKLVSNDDESYNNEDEINLIDIKDDIDTNNIDLYDINELENIKDINSEDNKINKSLEELIYNTQIVSNNVHNKIILWDESYDNISYDNELHSTYKKTYIYNQYILIDDTIKIIKNKICCGYGKSNKFNEYSPYFISSRLYLWSEYEYYDIYNKYNIDKIMLGQKWIKGNELLNVDIEPNNNLIYYENLDSILKNLQDEIRKYGSKIMFENDEENILLEYNDFIINNEIYMLDIYNELGLNYKKDEVKIKNLYDIYIKLYFPNIIYDDLINIINYLNNYESNIENEKILQIYNNINNDLIMENEIIKIIEELKLKSYLYKKYFHDNYITQAVIHINIKFKDIYNLNKIDLYRIFDNYITDDKYPFIQYQSSSSKLIFKLSNETNNKDLIYSRWFESAPYGISFKVKTSDSNTNKYISININESGRIEYKIQWKEEDKATIENIKNSYIEIKDLLKKINSENNKLILEIPSDDKFKFAFINSLVKFDINVDNNNKYIISHNDLSEFSRYFYPYVAVVIEPRRRQSKLVKHQSISKYGTYLRYKRISKYNNEINIEKKILYFLKNYEYNEKLLINEISKQFNITEKDALINIKNTIAKYPNIKKSRNILKKIENIKYKLPGIGIDIQGKQQYKIRITGARSNTQLNNIILFINILIYLYIEIYLHKNNQYIDLKNKLKLLKNIAKRKNKVMDIVEVKEDIKNIKKITQLDKERLAYKPEKGQNQWSRNCQNSGNKKRRPLIYNEQNINEMIEMGYTFNNNTQEYERKIKLNNKEIVLKAAKILSLESNNNDLYYTCNPEENGEYTYIGFLSRSSNPHGLCMPCCFKKDPITSKNKTKKNYHLKCLGKQISDIKPKKLYSDKLYILQDNIRIQANRYSYLPLYLDIFLNIMLKRNKSIKNNYLSTSYKWLFRYGIIQDNDKFLSTISDALDISINNIKEKINNGLLNNDNAESIFISLNNGNIKSQFNSIKSYLKFINTNLNLDYTIINDILSYPGIIHNYGVNIIIFEKIIKSKNMKDDDYNIIYLNNENIDYILNTNKINLILIKENDEYYPIYELTKKYNSKFIDINKYYYYDNNNNNIIYHIYQYLIKNYNNNNIINQTNINDAKSTFKILEELNLNNYYPTIQIIDNRYKCKYFILNNKFLFPVKPSGSLFWIPVITIEHYTNYINELYEITDVIYDIYNLSMKKINCLPIGFYYSKKINDNYLIDGIIIDNYISLPIKQINMSNNDINIYAKKYNIKNIYTQLISLYDDIDKKIIEYEKNKQIILDERIIEVNKNNYINEGYELFRLELSYFLNNNETYKKYFNNIINNLNITNKQKKYYIKKILYKFIDKNLLDIFNNIFVNNDSYDIKSNHTKFIQIDNEPINLDNYVVNNIRTICPPIKKKDKCNINHHCSWIDNNCYFKTNKLLIIKYINKISEELVNNKLKSNEILNKDNYYVQDIINKDIYTIRNEHTIIKSNNFNIKKILNEMFGINNIPIIGKRRINKKNDKLNDYYQLFPPEIIGNKIFQLVYNHNNLYRAFANSLYWINNESLDIYYRNLGYYSPLQTELSNYFKGIVIEWIININNQDILLDKVDKIININKLTFIDNFKEYLTKSHKHFYSYFIELYILHIITNYIIIIYNNYDNIICIFDKIIILDNLNNNIKKYTNFKSYINIKYFIDKLSFSTNIYNIAAIYINNI